MTKALIVGGGLGGLHAALALRRAGVDCVVLEKAAELRQIQVGIGMVLWPNGMNALRGVGLMNAVARTGARVDRITFDSHGGARLNSWPVGTLARRLGSPATAIDRASLHRVLARELDAGVLRLGSRVTAVEDDGNGVRVQMEDGAEERGDVLVGADGARSAVRPQLSGKHVAFPPYAGYTLWHAIIPSLPARPDVEAGTFALTLGVGLRFVSFSVDRQRTYWCALATEPAGGQEPRDIRRQKLLDMYVDFPASVRDLIAATDDTAVRRIDIYGGEPLSAWGSGRVTLLGDAAHPMTPFSARVRAWPSRTARHSPAISAGPRTPWRR